MTLSDQVIEFYKSFPQPDVFDTSLQFHNPFDSPSRKSAIEDFCSTYYNDENPRIHLLGINPSRLTATSTGVNYTDGYALQNYCGIANDFSKTRELTAEFFYEMINAVGKAKHFYATVFAWAALPVAITTEGAYINYYDADDPKIYEAVEENIKWMTKLPSVGKLVIVGSGQNQKFIESCEGFPFGYNQVVTLPHPRWIMQYNRKRIDVFIDAYKDALDI